MNPSEIEAEIDGDVNGVMVYQTRQQYKVVGFDGDTGDLPTVNGFEPVQDE